MPEPSQSDESPIGRIPTNTVWKAHADPDGTCFWISRFEKGRLRTAYRADPFRTLNQAEAAALTANLNEL